MTAPFDARLPESTESRLGRWSFAVARPLAPSCSASRIRFLFVNPRLRSTLLPHGGRPSAVASRFDCNGLLSRGLSPPRCRFAGHTGAPPFGLRSCGGAAPATPPGWLSTVDDGATDLGGVCGESTPQATACVAGTECRRRCPGQSSQPPAEAGVFQMGSLLRRLCAVAEGADRGAWTSGSPGTIDHASARRVSSPGSKRGSSASSAWRRSWSRT